MPLYYAVITTLGAQRLAEAQAENTPLVFTHIAVGDANGNVVTAPPPSSTALVNEVWRSGINSIATSPDAPRTIRIEGLIPANDGGFTIREVGVFNGAGELIVYASYPPTYKPNGGDGMLVDEFIRINIEVASVAAVELTVDPAVATATRADVEDATAGSLFLWESFT